MGLGCRSGGLARSAAVFLTCREHHQPQNSPKDSLYCFPACYLCALIISLLCRIGAEPRKYFLCANWCSAQPCWQRASGTLSITGASLPGFSALNEHTCTIAQLLPWLSPVVAVIQGTAFLELTSPILHPFSRT